MGRVWALLGTVGTVVVLGACGGGGATAESPKAAWTAKHGPAMAALNEDLQTARTTLSSLQRTDILGNCTQLRDSLNEARKGLPVPDPTVNDNLRTALDAIGVGTEDCVAGARGPDIPQLEKSFRELREAQTLLEVANRNVEAWT
jgi:hypothetical protein